MKRVFSLALALILTLTLCACGDNTAKWQEQYDLGQRYLTEGNYEEAILAFTAAIDIDPKRAPAYVGRGDAYTGTAELAEDGTAAWENAVTDYLTAIDLDGSQANAYYGAAEAYLAMGDLDAARGVLDRGYAATGDEGMREWAEALQNTEEETSETVTLEGVILYNPDTYAEQWERYCRRYQTGDDTVCPIDTAGVRFTTPAQVTLSGQSISVGEACLQGAEDLYDTGAIQAEGDDGAMAGEIIGQPLRMTGYFLRNEQTEELYVFQGDDGVMNYSYRPNGDYIFYLLSWERLD